jgi:hypothetical protein
MTEREQLEQTIAQLKGNAPPWAMPLAMPR